MFDPDLLSSSLFQVTSRRMSQFNEGRVCAGGAPEVPENSAGFNALLSYPTLRSGGPGSASLSGTSSVHRRNT